MSKDTADIRRGAVARVHAAASLLETSMIRGHARFRRYARTFNRPPFYAFDFPVPGETTWNKNVVLTHIRAAVVAALFTLSSRVRHIAVHGDATSATARYRPPRAVLTRAASKPTSAVYARTLSRARLRDESRDFSAIQRARFMSIRIATRGENVFATLVSSASVVSRSKSVRDTKPSRGNRGRGGR